MKRLLTRITLAVSVFALMLSFAGPAFATTYYGPSFGSPVAIAPGTAINIVLSTGSGTSIVPLPQGSSTPCTGACVYPQQPWTTATGCFYSVHEVSVTDPNGNEFMLGSATTSGLYWPSAFGGSGSGTSVPPQADALNVTSGDSFTIPFASGSEGFTFTSVLGNPPNDVTPAGPYYWWVAVTGAGNPNGLVAGGAASQSRLDMISYNPTTIHGTYTVDIEGVVACPTGSTTFTSILFFDAGITVTTPQFAVGAGIGLAVAAGLVGLVLIRRKSFKLPVPTVAA